MALELVATAFLTVAFEKLFEKLSSKEFADFFRAKKSVDEKLKVLNDKLKTVSLFVDDAEDKQIENPEVKKWLDDLKDVIFKVDDLVEDITEEARIMSSESEQSGSGSIGARIKSLFIFLTEFDRKVEADVTKFSEELVILRERADVLELKHGNPQNARSQVARPLAPLRDESSIFGREDGKEKIMNWLLSSDTSSNKIGVLPIVGMGGLGKTTLAQFVYNDERVKVNFELKAWVTVSTEFDVVEIIKNLLQQIGRSSDHTKEMAVLQGEMKEALRGKKFLLVLDDVWDENYDNWDLLKSNFTLGDSRSRIIITTRSRKVCSNVKTGPIHELEIVSEEDCWKIFVHHTFDGDLNAEKELQEMGRSIVEKCKGLPLAVKAVGGLLRAERNPKKWKNILSSKVWEWEKESRSRTSGVLPSLWLSYQHLPSPVKQCFAYCSVFPQDYEFDREDLVFRWMAEGFLLPGVNGKSLEEVGDEYFEILMSRSFFQRSSFNESYAMHDLVHDLATFVSGQFCLSLSVGGKVSTNISSKTRYLSYDAKLKCNTPKVLGEATYLHTYYEPITSYEPPTDSLVEEILEAGRFLRVLSTRVNNISALLTSSNNNLKHLRYLNLSKSDIKEVPDSVCTLFSLQTLVLSWCHSLSKLPTNMGNLINLRHLNIFGLNRIKKMPPRMGNLKELRTLTDFALGKADADEACSSMKELGELPHLAGELWVRGLQNVETTDDARKANFGEKSNLVKLLLGWESELSDTRREWEVLDALRPHKNIEELTIRGYAASSFPKWVGDSSFSKMVSLTLVGSRSHSFCSSLPPLGQLPSLKKLKIKFFYWVESIGWEFYGGSNSLTNTPFPCLETLSFEDMERWKEWSFAGNESFGCFPRLKQLQLISCPNLAVESFPEGGLPRTLESLRIENCRKLLESVPHWDLHRLTSLTSLTIINSDWDSPPNALGWFPQGLLPTSLTSLFLKGFPNLKTLNGTAFEQLQSLQSLTLCLCNDLESLPEQALPQSLRYLDIDWCRLLERRYRKQKGVRWHCISYIPQIRVEGPTTWELDQKEARESESCSSTIV